MFYFANTKYDATPKVKMRGRRNYCVRMLEYSYESAHRYSLGYKCYVLFKQIIKYNLYLEKKTS